MRKACFFFVWMAACCASLCSAWGHDDPGCQEVRHYLEERDGKTYPVLWCLDGGEGFRLTSKGSEGTHVTRTDASLHTLTWQVEDPARRTLLRAVREQNAIVVQGRLNGKPIDQEITLDSDPWFQATSLSLRAFVMSAQESIRFWSLRSNTLKAYKLQATKQGVDQMIVDGRREEAVNVEIRLTGWKAPFWAGHYWYRRADGLMLRYEGAGDAAGSSRIIISYVGGERLCEPAADGLPAGNGTDPPTVLEIPPDAADGAAPPMAILHPSGSAPDN